MPTLFTIHNWQSICTSEIFHWKLTPSKPKATSAPPGQAFEANSQGKHPSSRRVISSLTAILKAGTCYQSTNRPWLRNTTWWCRMISTLMDVLNGSSIEYSTKTSPRPPSLSTISTSPTPYIKKAWRYWFSAWRNTSTKKSAGSEADRRSDTSPTKCPKGSKTEEQ